MADDKSRAFGLEEPEFAVEVMRALEDSEQLSIRVPLAKADVVSRAIRAHDDYFASKKAGHRSFVLWFRFSALAFRTITLWPALNKAHLQQRSIELEPLPDALIISIGAAGSAGS